jgi:lysophospholipase L1-like esterase
MLLGRTRARDRSRGHGGSAVPPRSATVGPFSDANYFSTTSALLQAGGGSTFALLFVPTAEDATEGYAWCCYPSGGARGWIVGRNGAGQWVFGMRTSSGLQFSSTSALNVAAASVGIPHVLAVGVSPTHFRASGNGGAVVATAWAGTYTAATAGDPLNIGRLGGTGAPSVNTAVVLMAHWSSLLSDSDLARLGSYSTRSSLRFPSDLLASADWIVEIGRDLTDDAATITPRGGLASGTLARSGTLAKTYRSRAPWFDLLNTDAGATDCYKPGTAEANDRIRSSLGRVGVTTDATTVEVEYLSTIRGAYSGAAHVVLQCAGQADVTLATAADDTATRSQQSLQSGSKAVSVIEGAIANTNAPSGQTLKGTFVRNILFPLGSTVTTQPPPASRLVVYGDSISVGGNATLDLTEAWAALVRTDYPGRVTVEGWGGRSLYEDYAQGGSSVTALATKLAALCDGTSSNTIWIAIGTNDYGLDAQSAANFQTRYAALLTALRALTSATIYCQTPIARVAPASEAANGLGDTLGAYRTAITNAVAAAAISNCTAVDGSAFVSGANYDDGIHPNTTGHAEYKAAVKTALGY